MLNITIARKIYRSQTGLARKRGVSNTAGSNKEPVSLMNQLKGGFVRIQRTSPRSAPVLWNRTPLRTAATFRALFRRQSIPRVLKRLNSTWNTTRCKVASFSLRPLPKIFRILPVNVITDLARALSMIRARAYAEGSSL